MFTQITTKIKDDTLHWLCTNVSLGRTESVYLSDLQNIAELDFFAFNAVLGEFQKNGLVSGLSRHGTALYDLRLEVKAHTLLQSGGFAVIDALNEANIQKLLLELDTLKKQLEPDQTESINKVTTIMASIVTVLGAYSDNN